MIWRRVPQLQISLVVPFRSAWGSLSLTRLNIRTPRLRASVRARGYPPQ